MAWIKGREVMLSLVTDLSLEQNTNIIFSSHILNDINQPVPLS